MSAAIGSAAATLQQPETNQAGNAYAELSSSEFLEIILAELANQDPLAPNDTTAILEQLSSLRNIESQTALEDQLGALVTQNSISASSAMIGKFVSGLDNNNNTVSGLVESMSVEDGQPILNLAGGDRLAADRVTQVENTADLETQVVQQLLANLQVLDSSALVGMMVAGVDNGGEPREGVVTGINLADGDIGLELDTGHLLPLNNVRSFSQSP
ncbi:MAG: flagellar hook capping FlgD N-terminal domain-containing protein [Planctomycetota bacterium]